MESRCDRCGWDPATSEDYDEPTAYSYQGHFARSPRILYYCPSCGFVLPGQDMSPIPMSPPPKGAGTVRLAGDQVEVRSGEVLDVNSDH